MYPHMKKEALEVIQKVHSLCREKKIRLSAAESCTGGLISHYITYLPGASSFFEAGVVTYSSEAKQEILGISSDTLSAHGVISRETAQEMAEKIRLMTRTDYAVSTTGNLGPDLLENKDRGLIYVAVSRYGNCSVKELRLTGEREEIKEQAAIAALRFLADNVSNVL
ncbi:MAG: CinA family protein [Nitrospirae bacterium]|nr:CinA family protein [Nitrospirota bacterium]